jgi:hypothetical protein
VDPDPARVDQGGAPSERLVKKPAHGEAEIPLDLSGVPTVEDGLVQAKEYDRAFTRLAKESLGPPGYGEKLLIDTHLPLFAFINRAVSLHRAIVDGIRASNPHAVFTLMRAYLELVVLVHYVNRHPAYLEALERPASELRGINRKSPQALLNAASRDMPGVRHVYRGLSEMAHFGSTALWTPFAIIEDEHPPEGYLGTLRFGTPPHWHKPDDDRLAVAMLLENDVAALAVMATFAQEHVVPHVVAAMKATPDPAI